MSRCHHGCRADWLGMLGGEPGGGDCEALEALTSSVRSSSARRTSREETLLPPCGGGGATFPTSGGNTKLAVGDNDLPFGGIAIQGGL